MIRNSVAANIKERFCASNFTNMYEKTKTEQSLILEIKFLLSFYKARVCLESPSTSFVISTYT